MDDQTVTPLPPLPPRRNRKPHVFPLVHPGEESETVHLEWRAVHRARQVSASFPDPLFPEPA